MATPCIFSVDVEDWFHILDIPSAPPISRWEALPSHVEKNFLKLLDIFSEHDAHVTCFFLGWVAEKFPQLVREAETRGHEVASHGYAHRLVYELSQDEFLSDTRRSKGILEDLVGHQILGYRSSGFSVTERTPWFFEALCEAGFQYDSSVFPAPRQHGGLNGAQFAPYVIRTSQGDLTEFPITITKILGQPMCFFGGGYLRLFPYFLVKYMTGRIQQEGRPVIFYVHPREIDPRHPRLPMGIVRTFKSYVNLGTTESKLRNLFRDFEMTTFKRFLSERHHLQTRAEVTA